MISGENVGNSRCNQCIQILAENYTNFPYSPNIMNMLAIQQCDFAGAEGTYASRSFLFEINFGGNLRAIFYTNSTSLNYYKYIKRHRMRCLKNFRGK